MSFQFNQPEAPAMGGFFKPAEHHGHLVLIVNVHKIEDRFDQLQGRDKPAATCDVVDLDDPAQELREGALITHTGIVNRLHAGAHMVLGRIGKAPTKSGFEAWVLNEFDPAVDPQRAQAWIEARPRTQVSQPAAPAAAMGSAPQAPTAPAAPVQQQPPAPAAAAPVAPQAPAAVNPNSPEVQALLAQLQGQQPQ